jgi:hypothetical protein
MGQGQGGGEEQALTPEESVNVSDSEAFLAEYNLELMI